MKIALIVFCVIAVVAVAIEVIGRIVGNRETTKTAKLSPEELRAKQEAVRKAHAYGSGV